ncbi:MAG: hypothetical protein AB7F89_05990 [Pirellulaceae bacterium]
MKPGYLFYTVCGLVTATALATTAGILVARARRAELPPRLAARHGWQPVRSFGIPNGYSPAAHRLISTVWRPQGSRDAVGMYRLPPVAESMSLPASTSWPQTQVAEVSVLKRPIEDRVAEELDEPLPIEAAASSQVASSTESPVPPKAAGEATSAETLQTAAEGTSAKATARAEQAEDVQRPLSPAARAALAPALEIAHRQIHEASVLANRGAIFLARRRLEATLYELAAALDSLNDTHAHSDDLAAAFQALREAPDFIPRAGSAPSQLDVADVVARHRTPVLKSPADAVAPAEALRRYSDFAVTHFARAGRHLEPVAEALYALGKLSFAQAEASADSRRAHLSTATICFRSTLRIHDQHALAANELAVILAREGRLREARDLLQLSVAVQPHAETWRNLSVVHQRLGDLEWATRSLAHWQLAQDRVDRGQPQVTTATNGSAVYWVDKATFERGSLGGVQR